MTSRYSHFEQVRDLVDRPDERTLRVAALERRGIRAFVTAYFADHPDGQALARQVEAGLRESPGARQLASVPLMLALICDLAVGGQTVPKTRTEMLRSALLRLLERGDRRREREQKIHFGIRSARNEAKLRMLMHLAWTYFARGPLVMPCGETEDQLDEWLAEDSQARPRRFRALDDETRRPIRPEDLLDELLADGVLVRELSNQRTGYRFVLRSFHELCLAGYLATQSVHAWGPSADGDALSRWLVGRAGDWGRHVPGNGWSHIDPQTRQVRFEGQPVDIKPLNQPDWQPVWPLVAGWLDQRVCRSWSQHLLRVVLTEREDVLNSRLAILAACIAEAPRTQLPDEDWLRRMTTMASSADWCVAGMKMLAKTGRPSAVLWLSEQVADLRKPLSFRYQAAKVLIGTGSDFAIHALSRATADHRATSAFQVLMALEQEQLDGNERGKAWRRVLAKPPSRFSEGTGAFQNLRRCLSKYKNEPEINRFAKAVLKDFGLDRFFLLYGRLVRPATVATDAPPATVSPGVPPKEIIAEILPKGVVDYVTVRRESRAVTSPLSVLLHELDKQKEKLTAGEKPTIILERLSEQFARRECIDGYHEWM